MCSSPERRQIFRGLLGYRKALANVGLTSGVQWLCGSFTEQIEVLESRHPNDVDVVTFVHRPAPCVNNPAAWAGFFAAHQHLLLPQMVKQNFHCDAQMVDLSTPVLNVVNLTRFWFGLFSHRRNRLWKGILQVPLPVSQDDIDAAMIVGNAP